MDFNFKHTINLLLYTSVIGAAGWLITHVVDSYTTTPTLEYRKTVGVDQTLCGKENNRIRINIRNLSTSNKFKNLKFILRLEAGKNSEFIKRQVIAKEPAYWTKEYLKSTPDSITFPETSLFPGTELALLACYSGDDEPTFHIMPQASTVHPIESGVLTILIRNKDLALLILFIFWTMVVMCVTTNILGVVIFWRKK